METLTKAVAQALSSVSANDKALAGKLVLRPGVWHPEEPVRHDAVYLMHTSHFSGANISYGECGAHGDSFNNSEYVFKLLAEKGAKVYWQDHGAGIKDLGGHHVYSNLRDFLSSSLSGNLVYGPADDRALFEVLPRKAFDGGHYAIGAAVVAPDGQDDAKSLVALAKNGFEVTTLVRDKQPAKIQTGLLILAVPADHPENDKDLARLKTLITGQNAPLVKANQRISEVTIGGQKIDFTPWREKGVLLFYLERQKDLPLIKKALAIPAITPVAL